LQLQQNAFYFFHQSSYLILAAFEVAFHERFEVIKQDLLLDYAFPEAQSDQL